MKKTSALIASILLLAGLATTTAQAHVVRIPARCRTAEHPAHRLCAIHWHRHRTNDLREKMGLRKLPYGWMAEAHPGLRDRILTHWARLHNKTKHRYHVWRTSAWGWFYSSGADCVHHKEGSWTAYNPAGPYYGGFQYDDPTWAAAGGLRYARHASEATPLQQVIITRAKVADDGWGAWPNTARECGLL